MPGMLKDSRPTSVAGKCAQNSWSASEIPLRRGWTHWTTGTQIEVHPEGTTFEVPLTELVWITQPLTFHVGIDLKHLPPANQQMFYDNTLDSVMRTLP